MDSLFQFPFPATRTVTILYSELQDRSVDLSAKIEEGFGPKGLGILSVTDVPGFPTLRRDLLRLSSRSKLVNGTARLAKLPEDVKKELEDPHSRYNFGWSHGKENLESGKSDLLKGSFYANPILDSPTTDASLDYMILFAKKLRLTFCCVTLSRLICCLTLPLSYSRLFIISNFCRAYIICTI